MVFGVKLLNKDATLPRRANPLDAGYDVSSCEELTIPSMERAIVSTGISISIPGNTYARVAPRSGLAAKHGIDVLAGVVDASYTGEVKVILFNSSKEDFVIKKGDRIAQIIITKILTPEVVELTELAATTRGDKGFGSSG